MFNLRRSSVFISGLIALLFMRDDAFGFRLNVPDTYTAFSGDVTIHYEIPDDVSAPNAFVRLVLITNGRETEITNLDIDPKYKSGDIPVGCGLIEVAGTYEFHLYSYSGGPLKAKKVLTVQWPNLELQLPSKTHLSQSKSVQLNIISSAKCLPRLHPSMFVLELEYAPSQAAILDINRVDNLHSQPFLNMASNSSIQFSCSLFDLSGIYRASLKSSLGVIPIIARSNTLLTIPNPAYRVYLSSKTIFPCTNTLTIGYTLAQCPGPERTTKLRIYMLRRMSAGSIASPVKKLYVAERLIDSDNISISESCLTFEHVATGYCFQLITMARNVTIVNQTETCISAHNNSVLPVDGGWSTWSRWSECSRSCGPGERTRYRMCSNPTPNFGGAFCGGDSIQRKTCDTTCADSIPYTPLHSPNIDMDCVCGCTMTRATGKIIASGRCSRLSQWLISAPDRHTIKLEFSYLSLYQNKQWVKVRNGGSDGSDLIAFSDGNDVIGQVTSTSNQMLVEFYTDDANRGIRIYSTNATKPIHVHGFIASFTSNRTDSAMLPIAVAPVTEARTRSIWESTVTIVGIASCCLVVITAIAFVIYHRACRTREHLYKMAAYEESPRRMCKSTSMRSTPSHESHAGIEIEHDMQTPLTGGAKGVDRKRAKTPGSYRSKGSFSSVCSNNVKKLRTKVEIENGGSGSRSSPLTPQRDYCPVPQEPAGSRRASHKHKESENNISLFRTSPLVKPKIPRSPIVHNSPRVRPLHTARHHVHGENNSPSKYRNIPSYRPDTGRESQRVVMGSDHTPTNSVKSPPSESSTLHADCETPTNINNDVIFRKANRLNAGMNYNGDSKVNISKPTDIKLKSLNQNNEPEDSERNPASGTSDDSGSGEKDPGCLMTTSFIENNSKPRRPTSLTESYSKMSLSSALSKCSADGVAKDKSSVTSNDDRQNILPKPDGQSPKSQRLETIKVESQSQNGSPVKTSGSSTPRCVRSLRNHSNGTENVSNTTSPARSINTPSDVIELEYDDFIDMDDTYSYFDPVETEKLTWPGAEKVKGSKTPS